MIISKRNLSVAFLLLGSVLSGCKDKAVEPTPDPVATNQVTFTQGAQTTFQQNTLDTTGGTYGNDQINTASSDVLTQKLEMKGMTYDSASNVNMFVTTHANAGIANDTAYVYQTTAGDLYSFDYGVETLNNNSFVMLATGGQKVDIGWVLQMKMAAAAGTKWQACNTGVSISILGNKTSLAVVDSATMQADTTLTLNGEAVAAKHAVHVVTVSTFGITGKTYIDCYVATKYGLVFNVIHSSKLQGLRTDPVPGVRKIMLTHS